MKEKKMSTEEISSKLNQFILKIRELHKVIGLALAIFTIKNVAKHVQALVD